MMIYQMQTVNWKISNGEQTKNHIVDGHKTLCGINIPSHGKEVSVIAEATCRRCLNAYKRSR
jgi:hypothetical protein